MLPKIIQNNLTFPQCRVVKSQDPSMYGLNTINYQKCEPRDLHKFEQSHKFHYRRYCHYWKLFPLYVIWSIIRQTSNWAESWGIWTINMTQIPKSSTLVLQLPILMSLKKMSFKTGARTGIVSQNCGRAASEASAQKRGACKNQVSLQKLGRRLFRK